MGPSNPSTLAELLEQGVRDGVFPLCRAVVLRRGSVVFEGGNAPADTVFDLASVTKVFATAALALKLEVSLPTPLKRFFPDSPVAEATLEDLLFHRSGLPAFVPFFATAPDQVVRATAATPLAYSPRSQSIYSDLGFILLGAALEQIGGAPLDQLFATHVARPLGLAAHFRRRSSALPLPASIASTGGTRPREPAPGQEGMWSVPTSPSREGEVDDDNAWCMDGVSGHAGLFGTAEDVARFGQAVLEGWLRPPMPWRRDATPGSTRALGFDTPSAVGSSVGSEFGRAGPRGAIGHLGFTGTSLWVDLDRGLVVALLTNRVALGRGNLKIRDFRPRFHQAAISAQ